MGDSVDSVTKNALKRCLGLSKPRGPGRGHCVADSPRTEHRQRLTSLVCYLALGLNCSVPILEALFHHWLRTELLSVELLLAWPPMVLHHGLRNVQDRCWCVPLWLDAEQLPQRHLKEWLLGGFRAALCELAAEQFGVPLGEVERNYVSALRPSLAHRGHCLTLRLQQYATGYPRFVVLNRARERVPLEQVIGQRVTGRLLVRFEGIVKIQGKYYERWIAEQLALTEEAQQAPDLGQAAF